MFVLLLLGGLIALYFGAEALIRGSSALALRFGVHPLIVGLTVVAFGTSAPELVVSLFAAVRNQGDVAIGNILGSNIFNIAIILGVSALIRPLAVHRKLVLQDIPILLVISLLTIPILINGRVGRGEGIALFIGIILYTIHAVVVGRKESNAISSEEIPSLPIPSRSQWIPVLLVIGGIGLLALGSKWLVDGAIILARALGVGEAVIGLTIVAMGTSLPELVTSLLAATRRESDIAIGNIVGSNIFNLLCILGAAATVSPIQVVGIRMLDVYWMIGLSVLLLPFAFSRHTISRWEGGIFAASYLVYLALLWPKG